jgi:hypothetical protein
VVAPLAVEVGLKLPQAPAGVQLQVTPAFVLSLDTVAETLLVAPNVIVAEGAVANATEIGWVPPPEDEPPPPQPDRIAMASVARMSGFLITVLPQIKSVFRRPTGLALE